MNSQFELMKPYFYIFSSLVIFCISTLSQAQSPTLIASGNQIYCPSSTIPITTSFDIQNPSSSPINTVYLQISEGYDAQNEKLILKGNHPNISSNWNQATGKLQLNLNSGGALKDLINAVRNVNFQSTDINISGERVFSVTTGQANYLPSTGHYYEFVSHEGISWTEAKNAAEQRSYYGLQGYLATITSVEEAQLGGEQSEGAGWLGGTDEDTEGLWKWVTGPEGLNGGLVFWNGGNSGSTPNFAFWNINQPDNAHGGPGEDYLHITDPSVGIRGAWNDLRVNGDPPGVYHPKGYIVEYGGMPGDPEINISASTRISVPELIEIKSDYSCGRGKVRLSATSDIGKVYWFTTETGGNPIYEGDSYNPVLNSTTDFYVSAGSDRCSEGPRKKITAQYYDKINATSEVRLTNCANPNTSNPTSTFYLEEAIPLLNTDTAYNFDFYSSREDAEQEKNELQELEQNNAGNRSIYVRISNESPCYEIAQINLKVSTSSLPDGYLYTLSSCDDDEVSNGFHSFNLRQARIQLLDDLPDDQNFSITFYQTADDALNKTNIISDEENFINEVPYDQDVFVRIENDNTNACYSIGPYVQVVVKEIPEFNLNESGQVCSLQPYFELEILNAAGNYSYEWYDKTGNIISNQTSITIEEPGIYSVFAISDAGCISETKTIEIVDSGPANLTRDNIKITATGDSYEIEVLDLELLGNGNYEFALEDSAGAYQDEARFYNVSPGTHTLFSNDKNGCGKSTLELLLFGIPEYFTPNGDGYHDYWNLVGISNQYEAPILIYDRYGKLLNKLDPQSKGWDGTYNGKAMPSDDYWFRLVLEDGTRITGHFSLLRSTP